MSATMKPRTSFVTTPRATLAPRPPSAQPAERGTPAVDVHGFGFAYGERQVLRDLEFSIQRKAVTAIIGPSGCGKSTFLRSINRLNDLIAEARYDGDIEVLGQSIFAPGIDLVERMGGLASPPTRKG